MERILLQISYPDDLADFNDQLLILRQYITTDQLHDFHQLRFLCQQTHDFLTAAQETHIHILIVPFRQIRHIFGIAFRPVNGKIVTCIGQLLIQRPEAADKTLRILGNRLREIRTLRGYGTDDGYRPHLIIQCLHITGTLIEL